MNLSENTVQTLKAFAMINPSIVFKPGNVIKTVSPAKTILAKATIADSFDKEFAIYDLMKFLGAYSMFENADLDFGDKSVVIGAGKEKINYLYTDPAVVVSPPDKELVIDKAVVEFELTAEQLQRVMKAVGMVGAPEIAVTGEDGKVYVEALDSKTQSSTYRVEVGDTNRTFRLIMAQDKLKLLPCNYKVAITERFAYFNAPNLEYWVALEGNSSVD